MKINLILNLFNYNQLNIIIIYANTAPVFKSGSREIVSNYPSLPLRDDSALGALSSLRGSEG